VLTGLALAAPAQAAFPGQNGKIVFSGDDDIWTMNPDGSARTQLTSGPAQDSRPSWSPDGKKILFERYVASPFSRDVFVMDADGSNLQQITDDQFGRGFPDWSPDGTKIIYTHEAVVYTANPDGTNEQQLSFSTPGYNYESYYNPAWTSDGAEIAIGGLDCTFHCSLWAIFTIRPDGSGYRYLAFGTGRHDWSPDGRYLVFTDEHGPTGDGLGRINRDGSGYIPLVEFGYNSAWSPDGTKIVHDESVEGPAERVGELSLMNPDGTGETNITNTPSVYEASPDWQPIPINAYPRPKGATPFLTYLVPAYNACASPNRQHGPPLAFASCNPPTQSSNALTIGSADSNGKPTKSVSSVRFDTLVGIPSTTTDEADVKITVQVIDVYTQAGLADYAGEVTAKTTLRITDKLNTPHPGGPGAGTVSDIPYGFTIPCAATADTTIGGSCLLSTSADALAPGAVTEGKRSIWALGQVAVYDADDAPFMKQGIFVP
jgi:hypothetical protein